MAKVTYQPQGTGDPENTRVGSYAFDKGKSVEIKNEALLDKLSQNPWFKVTGHKSKDGEEKAQGKDDAEVSADTPETVPSLANTTYPTQAPGEGSKTHPGPLTPDAGTEKAAKEAAAETPAASARASDTGTARSNSTQKR